MTVEQLNKVKWLNRAFHAEEKLKALESLVRRDRERAQRVTVSYEGNDKGKSDGRVNGTEMALTRLADSEEKYESYRREYESIRAEIQSAIEALNDPELEAVLVYRYLEYLSVDEIAARMHYDKSTIIRKHKKGIDKVAT